MLAGFQAKGLAGTYLVASGGAVARTEVQLAAKVKDGQAALSRCSVLPLVIPELHGQPAGGFPRFLSHCQYVGRQVKALGIQTGPPYPGRVGQPAIITVVSYGQAVFRRKVKRHRLPPQAVNELGVKNRVRPEGAVIGFTAGEFFDKEAAVDIRFIQKRLPVFKVTVRRCRGKLFQV